MWKLKFNKKMESKAKERKIDSQVVNEQQHGQKEFTLGEAFQVYCYILKKNKADCVFLYDVIQPAKNQECCKHLHNYNHIE